MRRDTVYPSPVADPGSLPFADRWGCRGPEPSSAGLLSTRFSQVYSEPQPCSWVACAQPAEMPRPSDAAIYSPHRHGCKFQCPRPLHPMLSLLYWIHPVYVSICQACLLLASVCLPVTEDDERPFTAVSAVHAALW